MIEDAAAGELRILTITGEPGIGKSSMAAELMLDASAAGFAVLAGACPESARVPYLALSTALRQLLESSGEPTGAAVPAADAVEVLLGPESPADPELVEASTADRTRLRLFYRAAEALLSAADRQPQLLVVEDLHWVDEPSVALLEHLAVSAAQRAVLSPVPLVVAVTTRRGVKGSPAEPVLRRFERDAGHRRVELDGLTQLDVGALVHDLTGTAPSPPLLRAVCSATRGNPMLVGAVMRRLSDRGGLGTAGGKLTLLDAGLLDPAIDLDDELALQVAAAAPDAVELLRAAAVLGEGPTADLHAVLEVPDDRFDSMLDAAVRSGLLTEEADDYRFSHPEIPHAIRRGMSSRATRRMHGAFARRLEAHWGPQAARHAHALSRHARAAGPDAPATMVRRYARLAGEAAFAVGAWGDSAEHYDAALAAGESDAGDGDEVRMLSAIAHFRDHDIPGCQAHLEALAGAAKAAGDRRRWGRAALLLARCHHNTSAGSSSVAGAIVEEYLAAGDLDDDLAARAWAELANTRFADFDFAGGMAAAERAIEIASRVDDDEVAADVHTAAGIQHLAMLQFEEARRSFERSVEHASRLGDPWALCWGSSRLPLVHWATGDLREADRSAADAAELAAGHFDWAESALALATRSGVAAVQGRLEAAERLGSLGHQQYLRSDYIFAELLIVPSLIAGRALRGERDRAADAIRMLEACGMDVVRYEQAARALAGDRVEVLPSAFGARDPSTLTLFDVPALVLEAELGELLGEREMLVATEPHLARLAAAGMVTAIGWPASTQRLLGACKLQLGMVPEGLRLLRGAIVAAQSAEAELEAARCAVTLAGGLRGTGSRDDEREGVEHLERAAAAFASLGAEALARRVHGILSGDGGRNGRTGAG